MKTNVSVLVVVALTLLMMTLLLNEISATGSNRHSSFEEVAAQCQFTNMQIMITNIPF